MIISAIQNLLNLLMMTMIKIEDRAFWSLLEKVLQKFTEQQFRFNNWIGEDEAMKILGIKSKSEMWKLRTEGKLRYSQPRKKIIRYDRDSVIKFLEDHAVNTY